MNPPEKPEISAEPLECAPQVNLQACIDARVKLEEEIAYSGEPSIEASVHMSLSRAEQVFDMETFTNHQMDGYFQSYVETYREVLQKKGRPIFYYYDIKGKIVAKIPKPEDFNNYSDSDKQKWHNLNRSRLAPVFVLPQGEGDYQGYPFLAVTHKEGFGHILKNLKQESRDERYFENKSTSINDALVIITKAYDLDLEKALGLGSVESSFNKNAQSPADAYGIFQLKAGAYEDGVKYATAHPKLSASFRKGGLKSYAEDKSNRFVQVEVFCAYFKFLEKQISEKIKTLNERIQKIDPTFNFPDPEIAVLTAYNYGIGNIKRAIDRFAALSDTQIKQHIGEPPYGIDLWLGVLAHSFGADNKLGLDGFTYAAKVTAYGSLIMDREQTLEVVRAEDTSVESTAIVSEEIKSTDEAPENFSTAVESAKLTLDKKYSTLQEVASDSTTNDEKVWRRKYLIGPQIKAILPTMKEALTAEFVEDYYDGRERKMVTNGRRKRKETWAEYRVRRDPIYDDGIKQQDKYKAAAIKKGDLVAMTEDASDKPYFCEQIGTWSGTRNNKDSLYMRKEFEPLMSSLVTLVNHQIDLFNADPSQYGHKEFPKIPHISGIKISGALRSFAQMKEGMKPGLIERTTTQITPHSLGYALDLGSFATGGGHMVRFQEEMKDLEGNVKLKAGGKLSNEGFGKSTRPIISRMIGRALMALEGPLRKEGLKLMPLWEQSQLNWHVVILPI